MKTIFILLLLLIPIHAQRPVKPIRLSLSTEAGEGVDGGQLNRLVSGVLRKHRDVVFSAKDADIEVWVGAMRITQSDQCSGFVAAFMVTDLSSKHIKRSIDTGSDLKGMAERLAAKVDREFLQPRRSAH